MSPVPFALSLPFALAGFTFALCWALALGTGGSGFAGLLAGLQHAHTEGMGIAWLGPRRDANMWDAKIISYMPTPKLRFQEWNIKIRNTVYIIFRNTSANISPHFWNKSGCQILRKNYRAFYLTHSEQLRMLFLPIMLDCPPVKSFHNSIANFRIHASVTFLVNGDERPLLMGCFLKCLETSPFC